MKTDPPKKYQKNLWRYYWDVRFGVEPADAIGLRGIYKYMDFLHKNERFYSRNK